MGKLNWTVRVKNRQFWFALIPAIALAAQAVASIFGYTLDLSELSGKLVAAIDTIFGVLVIMGIVVDPTTKGIADSARALGYDEPHDDTAGLR